jgi:hypothetical protein
MANDLVVQRTAMDAFIERAATDPTFDVVKLEALLRMQREVAQDAARREFNMAMAAAQAEMQPVVRSARNTHTGTKYAKLETIDAEMRPIYTRHGFSVRFGTGAPNREGWMRVVCTIAHAGGHEEPAIILDAPLDLTGTAGKTNKTGIQAVGSSVSYLRRYLLTMAFNIVLADDPDDDGEAPRGAERPPPPPQPQQRAQAPADPLREENGTVWLRNLEGVLQAAQTEAAVVAIGGHPNVRLALESAPTLVRARINDLFREAHVRVHPIPGDGAPPAPPGEDWPDDPIRELIAEVDAMDLDALDGLAHSKTWGAKTRDLIPPDWDRLGEAIALRKAMLQQGRS